MWPFDSEGDETEEFDLDDDEIGGDGDDAPKSQETVTHPYFAKKMQDETRSGGAMSGRVQAGEMGPPVSGAQDSVVRDYLMKKYLQAADDKDVRTAEASAARQNKLAGILGGVGQMLTAGSVARGGQGVDQKSFQFMRDGAKADVDAARMARRERMDGVLTEDRMQQQGIERDRAGQEFGRKTAGWEREDAQRTEDDDPKSGKALVYQRVASQMQPGEDFSGMSYNQIKQVLPAIQMKYEMDQKRKAAGAGGGVAKPYPYTDAQGNKRVGKIIGTEVYQSPNDAITEPAPADHAFNQRPPEDRELIKDLAKKNANKISIRNQIDAVLSTWDSLSEDEKLTQGRQLIKTLNSTEGQDAVGTEEANRLAGKLSFAYGNLTNDNPIQFGRDLPGFKADATQTSENLGLATQSNESEIARRYGREPAAVVKKAPPPPPREDGVAYAAPAGELSPAELQEQMRARANPVTPAEQEFRIKAFMQKNGITDRDEAIRILRENKRL